MVLLTSGRASSFTMRQATTRVQQRQPRYMLIKASPGTTTCVQIRQAHSPFPISEAICLILVLVVAQSPAQTPQACCLDQPVHISWEALDRATMDLPRTLQTSQRQVPPHRLAASVSRMVAFLPAMALQVQAGTIQTFGIRTTRHLCTLAI